MGPRVAVAAILVVALFVPAPAFATQPGQNGDIFFTSQRDGNREVYSMHPSGTGLVNLTHDPATDDWPASDGQRVFFTSNRDGNEELYRQPLFTPGPSRLTYDPGSDSQPATTDIGLAWVTNRDGNDEIYSATNTNLTQNPAADLAPTWSGDAHRIAFTSDRDGNNEIYAMADVLEQNYTVTRLTNDPANDAAPNWSPNGAKIAFETNRDGNYEIYVMNTDGTGLTNLTNNPASDRQPSWSPDGTKIVFQSLRDGNFEIYKMNVDGTGQTRLTDNAAADVNPDWARLYYSGYPRPRGASPVRVPLVPAYLACAAPNRTHGSPLSFGSCNPPSAASSYLTTGSPDSNGAAAKMVGAVTFRAKAGSTGPPEDSDVKIDASVTDVRCRPATAAALCASENIDPTAGPDYAGDLQATMSLRITEHYDGSADNDPSTLVDLPFLANVECTDTPDETIGGVCSVNTSANALIPGMVKDTNRTIWQLGQVDIYDTGADGDPATAGDNSRFLTQGVFVP